MELDKNRLSIMRSLDSIDKKCLDGLKKVKAAHPERQSIKLNIQSVEAKIKIRELLVSGEDDQAHELARESKDLWRQINRAMAQDIAEEKRAQ